MRAVVDTNVWISALMSRDGSPGRLAEAIGDGLTPVFSDETFAELRRVSGKAHLVKSGLTAERFAILAERLRAVSEFVGQPSVAPLTRDATDDVFVAVAVAAHVDYFVSGDKDFLDDPAVREYLAERGVQLVTVREFVDVLESTDSEG